MGLIRIVHRWRGMVLVLAVGLPLVTAIVMLFTPNVYTARGTILLEVSTGDLGSELAGELSALTGFRPQVPSMDIYYSILRSRRVASAVADSLDLAHHYETLADSPEKTEERTLSELKQKVRFHDPNVVTIAVEATDPDPKMAAAIVNAYLEELKLANKTLSLSRARRTRQLVDEALQQTLRDLEEARRRLGRFQAEHGVFELDEQTQATLELIGTLQAQLVEAQTEREALRGFRQEGSAQMRSLDLRIEAIRSQINQLSGSVPGGDDPDPAETTSESTPEERDYLLPLTRVPELAETYSRILMDVKVLEAKYEVLATRLEQTKIEESQSIPSFEVLDEAERPYRKSGPNRKLYVLGALLAGLLGGVLLAVLLEDLTTRLDERTRAELKTMIPSVLRGSARRS
ncbi:MAG: hypothetical protein GF346_08620 [Candidatus Eisenbacteria bacterium]|nr:hypothetical protein [Candidatus Latescibacterota bacterium]MBD3302498.1 hypothetical protein [Candidatus Eisenbacteria bacterium]